MQNPLLELQEYENLAEALKKGRGPLQVTGTLDSQKVHLMYELGQDLPADGLHFPWKLVVTYDDTRAKEIYDDFRKDVYKRQTEECRTNAPELRDQGDGHLVACHRYKAE